MIEHEWDGRFRVYLYTGKDKEYTGKYLRLNVLASRSECVISKAALSQRLRCGIVDSTTFCWNNVMQCLTTNEKKGNHGHYAHKNKNKNKNKDDNENKDRRIAEIDSYFLNLMMIMPINNSKPLIIQGKSMVQGK